MEQTPVRQAESLMKFKSFIDKNSYAEYPTKSGRDKWIITQ